ncbi:hypothetical protein CHS0354_031706 [Potamilus streckersoni]|uniref:Nose resistant-to-fluoxetine protein N-terminal domain-containing protein n=1 Tax=Potamilus streckersoni TaxID=2493646 RepID=A0AAE0TBB7_9BIVA|nr:hypothetical protein CHS0354_031706 [Potamilus streckersoni]
MSLQIRPTLLLLLGLLCQTFCQDILITEDLSKLHKEFRKLQLILESIVTDGSPLAEIIAFPATIAVNKHASLTANDLRVGASPGYNVSDTCLNHTEILIDALFRKEEWAIRIIDALGKLESDIFDGNFVWPGSYDECLNTQAVVYVDPSTKSGPSYPYRGQYCMLSIPLSNKQSATLLSSTPALSVGICLPETCNDDDAVSLVRTVLSLLPSNVTAKINPTVQCQERDREVDGRATAVIIIASIIAVIIVLGTAYDVIARLIVNFSTETKMAQFSESLPITKNTHSNGAVYENGDVNDRIHLLSKPKYSEYESVEKHTHEERHADKGIVVHILLAFSIYSNAVKILSTKQAAGSLSAVNGIRCLSMFWVILGHTYAFGFRFASNMGSFFPKMLNRFTFQAIDNATVSVDSFFLLSGLLLAFLTFRELKTAGGIKEFRWGMFYFHRFWRLTPPYMLLMMVYVPTVKYWSDGPLWPKDGFEIDYCKDSWWTNLLYINNFVNADKMCMAWSWYLANDMQFFVVSPILLIALYKSPIIGGIVSSIFLIASFITSGVIASVNNVSANIITQGGTTGFLQLYIKPYCRIGPYIVGILTGYILFKTDCNVKIGRIRNLVGWLTATGIALAVLYGLYSPNNNNSLSIGVSALYMSLARTAWGVALAWVIFACATGNGGFINTLLSWNVYVPLGRLTYCAYLTHPIVMILYYSSLRNTIVFNDLEISYLFVSHLVFAYAAAFILSLAFESPMMGLEKVLFKRDKRS